MWNSSRIDDNAGSIYENIVATLPSYEETFAILSFNDLDLCSSPCLDEDLMFSTPKLSRKVQNMAQKNIPGGTGKTVNQPTPDGEEFSLESALAQLSPGVEFADCETLLSDPGNPAEFLNFEEVGLLLNGGPKVSPEDLNAEFEVLESLSTIETTGIGSDWLTNTTVALPDQLKFAGTYVSQGSLSTATSACKAEKVWVGLTSELDSNDDDDDDDDDVHLMTNSSLRILQEISIPSAVQDTSTCDTEEEPDTSLAATGSSTQPTTSSRGRKRRRPSLDPGSEEYKKKRELNNISVRKSREKARQKHHVTEERVGILSEENNRLQSRVDSLEKELTILKGLFSNIGAALPGEVTKFLSSE